MSESVPTLYHGTSTSFLDAILTEGLRCPCLTDQEERAWYYAEECADENGGEPTLVRVMGLDPARLRADRAAIEEPVMTSMTEDELWERADLLVDGLGLEGWAEIPWRRALELCGSVRHDGDVSAALIAIV